MKPAVKLNPKVRGTPKSCAVCGHKNYHHLNIVATCAKRCQICEEANAKRVTT